MTAPVVSIWDAFAQNLADAFAEVATVRGDDLDRDKVLAEIRACLMEPVVVKR